jgi:hypothetical protein
VTKSSRILRDGLAIALAACVACQPALALVTLNDGHDHIDVTASFGVTHDSNIFAAAGSTGDTIYNGNISAAYTRRAGWIGINANTSIASAHFGKTKEQSFDDPNLSVELTKNTGRTKGSLTLSAARESRADPAINTRATLWNYSSGLNFRYHIYGAYDLSGTLGYSQRDYVQDQVFSNLSTYTTSLDLFHVFSAERDASIGYRYRYSETSRDTASTDHGINLGLYGRIVRGLNGSVRFGYQTRIPEGKASGDQSYQSWTASGSLNYPITKKFNLSAQIGKDFSTTATATSVDALSASLDAQYSFSSRWGLSSSVGWSDSRFIGDNGRVVLSFGPPLVLGPGRHDTNMTWSVSTSYAFSEHLKLSLSYSWFENWSNIDFADFVRSAVSAGVTSHW